MLDLTGLGYVPVANWIIVSYSRILIHGINKKPNLNLSSDEIRGTAVYGIDYKMAKSDY
jgi:hypothetical protein